MKGQLTLCDDKGAGCQEACREGDGENARDLVDVGRAHAVILRVPVQKNSPVEEGIRRRLDPGHERAGAKAGLLDVAAAGAAKSVSSRPRDARRRIGTDW